MKNIISKIFSSVLIGHLILTVGFAQAANDLRITQRNPANTAWADRTITSLGNAALTDAVSFRAAIGAYGSNSLIPGAQGGTGVANTGKTITLGGNVTTSGSFNLTTTLTGNTSVTLPTTGTLASATPIPIGYLNQQYVYAGDSLTSGLTSPNTISYPGAMALRPPVLSSGTVTNYGVPGIGLTTLVSNYASTVATKTPALTGSPRAILYVWIGANDYQDYVTNAAATYYAALASYWTTAKSAGFTVVAFTIMKRTGITNDALLMEQNRMAINTLIRASAVPDILVDADLIFPDPTNTAFFLSDGTHLNDNGNRRLAASVIASTMSQGQVFTPSPPTQSAYPTLPVAAPGVLTAASITYNTAGTGLGTISPAIPALGSGAWSAEAWVNASTTVTGSLYVLAKSGGSGFGVGVVSATTASIFEEHAVAASPVKLFPGAWNHIAVTKAVGGVVTYYLNGVSIGTSTDSTTGTDLNRMNVVGKPGQVARIRVYSRAITAAEVLASYNRLSVYDPTDSTITYAMADPNTGLFPGIGDLTTNAAITTLSGGAFVTEPVAFLNQPAISGPAQISQYFNSPTVAAFSHKSFLGLFGSYAMLQDSGGTTYVNAPAGQKVTFRIGDVEKAYISNAANFQVAVPLTITGTLGVSGAVTLTTALTVPNGGTGNTTITGLVLGNGTAAMSGVTTSAGVIAAISDETGSGPLTFATSPTLTTPNIVGTTAVGNATAGSVGEIISSAIAVGSAVSISTNTTTNVTSISLTAGDWDVDGNVNFALSGATTTALSAGINTTTATIPTDGSEAYSGLQLTAVTTTDSITLPRKRINVSGTTTVYLSGRAIFSLGTVTGYGAITARRVR